MAEVKTDQEPSIEEILESIRQIISEDGDTPEKQPAAAAPPPPPPPRAAPKPQPTPKKQAENVLDLTEKVVDEPEEPAFEIALEEAAEESTNEGLLSDVAADASAYAMARLLAGNVAVERELPGRVGKVTLEDMARDLMRPLVKSWLDQNLPAIVEKMVAREIEKVSRIALKK